MACEETLSFSCPLCDAELTAICEPGSPGGPEEGPEGVSLIELTGCPCATAYMTPGGLVGDLGMARALARAIEDAGRRAHEWEEEKE